MNSKDLYDFYHTENGCTVQCLLSQSIVKIWSKINEKDIFLAFGYSNPYLAYFLENTSHCFTILPKSMGNIPSSFCQEMTQKKHVVLRKSYRWPFKDSSINYLLMIHGFEFMENPSQCLKEAWRTLNTHGELLLILPNKYGPWICAKNNPLSKGAKYSYFEIYQLLENSGFEIIETQRNIYFWPLSIVKDKKMALQLNAFNKKIFNWWPGVFLIKIKKTNFKPVKIKKYIPSFKLQLKT